MLVITDVAKMLHLIKFKVNFLFRNIFKADKDFVTPSMVFRLYIKISYK